MRPSSRYIPLIVIARSPPRASLRGALTTKQSHSAKAHTLHPPQPHRCTCRRQSLRGALPSPCVIARSVSDEAISFSKGTHSPPTAATSLHLPPAVIARSVNDEAISFGKPLPIVIAKCNVQQLLKQSTNHHPFSHCERRRISDTSAWQSTNQRRSHSLPFHTLLRLLRHFVPRND